MVVLWKERNARCFEGVSSSIDSLCEKIKFFVASWVSILPPFQGVPMDFILHKWKGGGFFLKWSPFTLVVFWAFVLVSWISMAHM